MTEAIPRRVLWYGVDEPLPEQIVLRAGPLSLSYTAGDLRSIRLGDRVVLDRIYVAVRDHNWGTVPATLSDVRMHVSDDAFQIAYTAMHRQGPIAFGWSGTITGSTHGTIVFEMDGVAQSTFLKNRIGLCVLHPMRTYAGAACQIEHVDGTVTDGVFPAFIAPYPPFTKIRAIRSMINPGVQVVVRFSGDVFEMEDQRNWTDASFKTYSTPLDWPYPVEVPAGTRIVQSVTLTLSGANVPVPDTDESLTVTFDRHAARPLPQLGLGSASHGQPLSDREMMRLAALNLAHLRVDLVLAEPEHAGVLRRAADEARALNVPLEVALTLSDNADDELRAFVALLVLLRPSICRWLIFHAHEKATPARWIDLARSYLTAYDPHVPVGAGAAAYFTELNRFRPPAEALDFVCYSLNPQVHAFDNASLVETLAGQAATVASARHVYPDHPVAVTPITLKPRFNPDATAPDPAPAPGELPWQVDARQMSLFGAGWTLGSIKHMAERGAASVTYYETSGWRGVMETKHGSPVPERFHSIPGAVFPLYYVLADVSAFAGGEVLPSVSSHPFLVESLALHMDGRTRILLANFSDTPQAVAVQGMPEHGRVRRLDETTVVHALQSPETWRAEVGMTMATVHGVLQLTMLPYAVVRIDLS